MEILESRKERAELLKTGFTGKKIETLYIDLNHFETVGVNWDDAATNQGARA